MRVLNVLGAFLVLICNLVVSFNHTLELFRAGGFKGTLAPIGVIAVETTFILGALNLVVSRLKGVSPGGPAIMGGLLGVALVTWSNVRAGWSYGLEGILLGLATPVSLVISEAILSRAILQRAKMENPTVTNHQNDHQPTKYHYHSDDHHFDDYRDYYRNYRDDYHDYRAVDTIKTVHTTQTVETDQPQPKSTVDTAVDTEQMVDAQAVEDTEQAVEDTAETVDDTEQTVDDQPEDTEQTVEDTEQAVEDTAQTVDTPDQLEQKAVEEAMRIYQKEGKLPGRVRLERMVPGCTQHIARKVLRELKKQIEENQETLEKTA